MRGHILRHHRARANHRTVANGDTRQEDRACADPHVVTDDDRADCWRLGTDAVLARIHDNHVPRDFAVPPDAHLALGDNLHIMVQIRAVADENAAAGETFQPDAWEERHVLTDDLPAAIDYLNARFTGLDDNHPGGGEFATQQRAA